MTEAVPSLVPSGPLQTAVFSWSSGALGPTEPVQQVILHIYTAKGLREYAFAAAEKLAELGKLDSKEHKGKTALLVAVTANHPEIVQDLLSLGADINACDVKGQTALHLAATYGFPRVMQVILSIGPGVNLEARNYEGNIYLIVFLCFQEIKSNKTVLHLAVKEGNIQLVRHLLKTPLDNMRDFVNMKAHGHTALHMAAGLHGSPHQEEMLRLLLSGGADPSIRNLENDQPAHLLQNGPHGEQVSSRTDRQTANGHYVSLI
uniref:Uncharacterized protein n=1 Tax=Hucho hucho TaxID=62062 RepID=A0A4W5M9C3_9TELE